MQPQEISHLAAAVLLFTSSDRLHDYCLMILLFYYVFFIMHTPCIILYLSESSKTLRR